VRTCTCTRTRTRICRSRWPRRAATTGAGRGDPDRRGSHPHLVRLAGTARRTRRSGPRRRRLALRGRGRRGVTGPRSTRRVRRDRLPRHRRGPTGGARPRRRRRPRAGRAGHRADGQRRQPLRGPTRAGGRPRPAGIGAAHGRRRGDPAGRRPARCRPLRRRPAPADHCRHRARRGHRAATGTRPDTRLGGGHRRGRVRAAFRHGVADLAGRPRRVLPGERRGHRAGRRSSRAPRAGLHRVAGPARHRPGRTHHGHPRQLAVRRRHLTGTAAHRLRAARPAAPRRRDRVTAPQHLRLRRHRRNRPCPRPGRLGHRRDLRRGVRQGFDRRPRPSAGHARHGDGP
ncbi:MAG: hypothetical protein AVDCRST_MAG66-2702, partial [uncultured Pseudonocardia sp.]